MKLYYSGRELRPRVDYPLWGMVLAVLLIFMAPFVNSVSSYLAFLICAFRVVRYDAKVFATDYCLLVPLTNIFRTAGGMSFMVYLCLFAAVCYFIRGGMRGNAAYAILILLLNYLFLRMNWEISKFLLCFAQLALICILIPEQDERSAARTAKYFCVGLVISSVYALIFRNTWQLQAARGPEDQAIWGTGIMRFQGLLRDPNYYMTMLIVGLALLAKLNDLRWIRTGTFLALGICMTMFGALTYSKTFFLVFVLFGLLYIVWRFWDRKYFRGIFLTIIVALGAVFVLQMENSPFAVILERFRNAKNISDFTTGRTEVYQAYWRVITKDYVTFLFGVGMNAEGLYKDPHNYLLEVHYYVGAVGLLLMLAFYVAMIRVAVRGMRPAKKLSFISRYVVPLMVIPLYMSLHGMYEFIFYGCVFMALMSVKMTEKQECGYDGLEQQVK